MLEYKIQLGYRTVTFPSISGKVSKESIEADLMAIWHSGGIPKTILSDQIDEIKSLFPERIRLEELIHPLMYLSSSSMIALKKAVEATAIRKE